MIGLTGSNWSAVGPYVVGSYEEELHPFLERLLAKAPPLVVNIGHLRGTTQLERRDDCPTQR